MKKTTVHIKGMHCTSCELLIEDELKKIPCVKHVNVSHKHGQADIYHDCECLNGQEIEKAVGVAGYSLGWNEKLPILTKNWTVYHQIIMGIGILAILYLGADLLGLLNGMSPSGNLGSLPVVLLIGLTAGVSTCMALVGGLILGASAKFAKSFPNATPAEKFRPHLFFNIGRIASYFVLGGVIGLFGSVFQLSPTLLGIMTLVVGLVMMLLGIQLTGISPRLSEVKLTLPKGVSRLLGIKTNVEGEYSDTQSMVMGAMTFFLPCGFTQAMQLYAMSTGSPIKGALTLGVFAIGTAPGLLGIGGLTSVVKGAFAQAFFRFVGVAVIGMALFNIQNGYNLSGLGIFDSFGGGTKVAAASSDPNVTIENGIQIVRMRQLAGGYEPNSFTIKKDIPTKWIITSETAYSCAASIVSSQLGISQALEEGENIIEFTPKEAGVIRFTCSMGMMRGSFTVVDSGSTASNDQKAGTAVIQAPQAVQAAAQPQTTDSAPSCGGSGGGCGCGSGGAGAAAKQAAIETAPAAEAETAGETQIIKATYTLNEDIDPKKFTVKAGKPVEFTIDAKEDGQGCMSTMMLPKLSKSIFQITKGTPIVFKFTPDKPGTYPITCAMGVPRGQIIVE